MHPEVIWLKDDFDLIPVEGAMQCPVCGKIGSRYDFDVVGADPNCVFCTNCNTELHE